MFLCQVDILKNEPAHHREVFNYLEDYWANDGKEVNNNFSHDNLGLIACWCKLFAPKWLRELPLFGRHSWRPDNFLFFFYVKYPYIGFVFLPLLSLVMAVSMIRVWRTNKRGHRYIDTDGKIISFFKCRAFNLRLTKKLLNFIIKKHPDLKTWIRIFKIYFPEGHKVLEATKSTTL